MIYLFAGESATVTAAEGSTAVATFPKAVRWWKSESCPTAGCRWQGGQQIFKFGANKYCKYWWQGGQQILLSTPTNIAIIFGKVGNKNVSAATLSLCPISQGLPAQLIVQGQAGGKGLPATVTVQQLQQIVKSVAGGGQGQPTQQVKPPLPICLFVW